jgi:hypothetical protein
MAPTLGRNNSIVVEPSSMLLLPREIGMDIVKSSTALIVLLEEVVRFRR